MVRVIAERQTCISLRKLRNGEAFSITKRACKFLIARARWNLLFRFDARVLLRKVFHYISDIACGDLFSDLFQQFVRRLARSTARNVGRCL